MEQKSTHWKNRHAFGSHENCFEILGRGVGGRFHFLYQLFAILFIQFFFLFSFFFYSLFPFCQFYRVKFPEIEVRLEVAGSVINCCTFGRRRRRGRIGKAASDWLLSGLTLQAGNLEQMIFTIHFLSIYLFSFFLSIFSSFFVGSRWIESNQQRPPMGKRRALFPETLHPARSHSSSGYVTNTLMSASNLDAYHLLLLFYLLSFFFFEFFFFFDLRSC